MASNFDRDVLKWKADIVHSNHTMQFAEQPSFLETQNDTLTIEHDQTVCHSV